MLIYCLCLLIWIYLLSALHRAKLFFAKFIVGCVGMFFFTLILIEPFATKPLADAVAAVAGIIGHLMGIFEAFPDYSLIFINRNGTFISFYIDYECSGIIEIIAYFSLLFFFPLYDTAEKAVLALGGFAWIFFANVLRIIVISAIIYIFGNNVFYFAHTVFGRLLFYAMSVGLYFYVFTKAHISRQRVGQFGYGDDTDKTL